MPQIPGFCKPYGPTARKLVGAGGRTETVALALVTEPPGFETTHAYTPLLTQLAFVIVMLGVIAPEMKVPPFVH